MVNTSNGLNPVHDTMGELRFYQQIEWCEPLRVTITEKSPAVFMLHHLCGDPTVVSATNNHYVVLLKIDCNATLPSGTVISENGRLTKLKSAQQVRRSCHDIERRRKQAERKRAERTSATTSEKDARR